jgi:hypothetical protein
MQQAQKRVSASGSIVLCSVLLNGWVVKQGFLAGSNWYALLLFTLPLLLVSIIAFKRKQL